MPTLNPHDQIPSSSPSITIITTATPQKNASILLNTNTTTSASISTPLFSISTKFKMDPADGTMKSITTISFIGVDSSESGALNDIGNMENCSVLDAGSEVDMTDEGATERLSPDNTSKSSAVASTTTGTVERLKGTSNTVDSHSTAVRPESGPAMTAGKGARTKRPKTRNKAPTFPTTSSTTTSPTPGINEIISRILDSILSTPATSKTDISEKSGLPNPQKGKAVPIPLPPETAALEQPIEANIKPITI